MCSFVIGRNLQRKVFLEIGQGPNGEPLSFRVKATGVELLNWLKSVLGTCIMVGLMEGAQESLQLPSSAPIPATEDLLFFVRKRDTQFSYLADPEQKEFCGEWL